MLGVLPLSQRILSTPGEFELLPIGFAPVALTRIVEMTWSERCKAGLSLVREVVGVSGLN